MTRLKGNNAMKKVLQIIPSLELGGTEAFVMNYYRTMNREDIQFDFLVFAEKEWPYLKEIEKLGGNVYYAPSPSLRRVYGFYKHFVKVLRFGGPYEAIHCHADADNAIPLLCGFLCGVKIRISHSHSSTHVPISSVRGWIFLLRKILIRLMATKYLACSNKAGHALYGRTFFDKHGSVVKNGIFVDKFHNVSAAKVEALKQEFGITQRNDLIVGNISRFDKNKNQIFAIKVFEHLLSQKPNALLLLGGVDAGELKMLQEYVVERGLDKNVLFIGKRSDVEVCLKLMDVFLLPSVQEGFSISLLEAQASGCLCIASTGVPQDVNMELETLSYLSLSDDAKSWAETISKKLEIREIPAENAVNEAFDRNGFDICKGSEELLKYYG